MFCSSLPALSQSAALLSTLEKANLTLTQGRVLIYLLENIKLVGALEDNLTIEISINQIAKALGINYSQVQRSVSKLRDSGYIARRQLVKKDGEVAQTMALPKSLALFGIQGHFAEKHELPIEVAKLLIGQKKEVIITVCDAWAKSDHLPPSVDKGFVSDVKSLEELRHIMFERHVSFSESTLSEDEKARLLKDQEAKGEFPLSLPDGSTVTLSKEALKRAIPDRLLNLVCMKFVRDAIVELCAKSRHLVTRDNLPKLIADIAYSRTNGFVLKHDANKAIRVLASCMNKSNWSKPKGMPYKWYDAAAKCFC